MDINISIPWKDGDGTIFIQGDYSTITITSLDRNSPTGKQRLIFTTISGRDDEDFTILDVWYTNGLIEVTDDEGNQIYDDEGNIIYTNYYHPDNLELTSISENGTIKLTEDGTLQNINV